jgi:hypothetical protein
MTATLYPNFGSTSFGMRLGLTMMVWGCATSSEAIEVVSRQATLVEPIRRSEAELDAWGAAHQPSRSWYAQDEEDLS